jgi:hypothetical protein
MGNQIGQLNLVQNRHPTKKVGFLTAPEPSYIFDKEIPVDWFNLGIYSSAVYPTYSTRFDLTYTIASNTIRYEY